MSLENRRLVTVVIDFPGLGNLGVFEVRTGGNATSENTDYAPGGMAPRVQLGGQQTTEDVTVNRVIIPSRDRPIAAALFAARGIATAHVSDSLLDVSKNPYGQPITWHGILGEVHWPDADSESNDPARLELVINAHGGISA